MASMDFGIIHTARLAIYVKRIWLLLYIVYIVTPREFECMKFPIQLIYTKIMLLWRVCWAS